MIALQSGRPAEAVELIGQAIAANDSDRGLARQHRGSLPRARPAAMPAIAHYRKAVAIDAGYWAAHSMLADLLRDAGDTAAAIAHYQKAVAAKPDLATGAATISRRCCSTQGRANEAVDAVVARAAAQDTEASRALFVQCVRDATAAAGRAGVSRADDARAVAEVWGRPVELATAALTLVSAGGPIRAAIQAIDGVWPRRVHPNVLAPVHAVADAGSAAASRDGGDAGVRRGAGAPAGLRPHRAARRGARSVGRHRARDAAVRLRARAPVLHQRIRLPSAGRRARRHGGAARQADGGPVRHDAGARHHADRLRVLRAAALARSRPPRSSGANGRRRCKACSTSSCASRRRKRAIAPPCRASPRSPTRPRCGCASNTRRTPIRAGRGLAPVRPAAGIAAYLRDELALGALRDDIAEPRAARHPDRRLRHRPAADRGGAALSRTRACSRSISASPASPMRSARRPRSGSRNIEFAQADILAFDPARPLRPHRGERRAASPRRPDGGLVDARCGCSSRAASCGSASTARSPAQDVVAGARVRRRRRLRRHAGQHPQLPPEPDEIRRPAPARGSPRSPDFYSTSACRDLLFHVQEHRLTLPQIAAFLAEHAPVVPRIRARTRRRSRGTGPASPTTPP